MTSFCMFFCNSLQVVADWLDASHFNLVMFDWTSDIDNSQHASQLHIAISSLISDLKQASPFISY